MSHRPPSTPMETLGPCPPWCDGVHAEGGEQWGISQFHETHPLKAELVVNDFRYEIAEAVIAQYPRASDPERRNSLAVCGALAEVEQDPRNCLVRSGEPLPAGALAPAGSTEAATSGRVG